MTRRYVEWRRWRRVRRLLRDPHLRPTGDPKMVIEGSLDVLPVLTLPEQAHAASHVGLARAMWRTTNERVA